MREIIQRTFTGKLKAIKEAKKKNFSFQNVENKIQDVDNKIQEANTRTSVSIQKVDNKIQEANKKIVRNTNRLEISQLMELFQGKSILFIVLIYFKV